MRVSIYVLAFFPSGGPSPFFPAFGGGGGGGGRSLSAAKIPAEGAADDEGAPEGAADDEGATEPSRSTLRSSPSGNDGAADAEGAGEAEAAADKPNSSSGPGGRASPFLSPFFACARRRTPSWPLQEARWAKKNAMKAVRRYILHSAVTML